MCCSDWLLSRDRTSKVSKAVTASRNCTGSSAACFVSLFIIVFAFFGGDSCGIQFHGKSFFCRPASRRQQETYIYIYIYIHYIYIYASFAVGHKRTDMHSQGEICQPSSAMQRSQKSRKQSRRWELLGDFERLERSAAECHHRFQRLVFVHFVRSPCFFRICCRYPGIHRSTLYKHLRTHTHAHAHCG